MSDEPELTPIPGFVDPEVRAEFPGLRLFWIEVATRSGPSSREVKARLRAELQRVEARANTALHEGWLTGCKAIASDNPNRAALTRCFLLTEGLANVGVQDPEQIASDAAGIRANAGIGTSTFDDPALQPLLESKGVVVNAQPLDSGRAWWISLLISIAPAILIF